MEYEDAEDNLSDSSANKARTGSTHRRVSFLAIEDTLTDRAPRSPRISRGQSKDAQVRSSGGGNSSRRRVSVGKGALKRRLQRHNDTFIDVPVDANEEETRFLRILDLLEEQDEFLSSSEASVLDDEDEDDDLDLDQVGHVAYSTVTEDEASEEDAEDNPMWLRVAEDWGPLALWELAAALRDLRHRRMPAQDVCSRILRDVATLYSQSPNVVHLSRQPYDTRLIIVGDLHGHFGDLMHILDEHGDPMAGPGGTSYLFNGDLVDRGMWGPEVLLLIYCLKLTYPPLVHLNRGNHEDEQQNKQGDNGFSNQHCMRAWKGTGRGMYALCRRSFKQLPLMHVIDSQVAVMHGGLPLDSGITLAEINSIDRKHRVPVFSCNLLGYPRNQCVKAKRTLESDDGDIIAKGTHGRIVRQVNKSLRAVVKFAGGVECSVALWGAPELEQDITVAFESRDMELKLRLDRIFVGLLWSDPGDRGKSKPSRRGVGWTFDVGVTLNFLATNNLRCMIRSHEKRKAGFELDHICPKMGAVAGTIFSASNYPTGAGEPVGNQAAVIVLALPQEHKAMSLPLAVRGWREPYASSTSRWVGSCLNGTMLEKLQQLDQIELDELDEAVPARVRVVKKLRSMIYCARPALLAMWNSTDKDCSGTVNLTDWANAMRACVIPDEEFPWEWIARYITQTDAQGACRYADFLGRYENKLLRRLSQKWHGGALAQIAPGISTVEDAEKAWQEVDRDGNGKLTYLELRPLLRTHSSQRRSKQVDFSAIADDDRVFSVLQNLDHDRSGFVDKEEFIKAVVAANRRKSLLEKAQDLAPAPRISLARRSVFAFHSGEHADDDESEHSQESQARRGRCTVVSHKHFESNEGRDNRQSQHSPNVILDMHLAATGNDIAIVQCWVATQSVLRSLAAARCSVSAVFAALDEDNDGDVDRAEFKEGLMQLIHDQSLLTAMDQWEPLLWRLVDEDSSGRVSHCELAELLEIRDLMSL